MVTRLFRESIMAKPWSERRPSMGSRRPSGSRPSSPSRYSPSRSRSKSTHLFSFFAPENNNLFSLSNFSIPVYIRGERLLKILSAIPFTCSEIQLLAHEFYTRCGDEQCWDLGTFSSQFGYDKTIAARVVVFARNQDLLLQPTNQPSSPYMFLPTRRVGQAEGGFTDLKTAWQADNSRENFLITFEEFLITCTHVTARGSRYQRVNLAFAILDENHDHTVSKDELFSFICSGRENDPDAQSQFNVLWETLTSGYNNDLLSREAFENNCPQAVLRTILVNQTWITKILNFTSSVESQRAELEVQRFLLEISVDEELDVETVEKTGEILNDHFVHTVSDLRTLSVSEMKKMGIPNQTASRIQRRVQLKQLDEEVSFHTSLQSKYSKAFRWAILAIVIFFLLIIVLIFSLRYDRTEGVSIIFRAAGHTFGHAIFIFLTLMVARLWWNPLSQHLDIGPFYPTNEYIRQLFLNQFYRRCRLFAILCIILHGGMEIGYVATMGEKAQFEFENTSSVWFRMETGIMFVAGLIVCVVMRYLLDLIGQRLVATVFEMFGAIGLAVLIGWHTGGVSVGFYVTVAVALGGLALIFQMINQTEEAEVVSSRKLSLYPTHVVLNKPEKFVESNGGQYIFISSPQVPLQWFQGYLCQPQKSERWQFYLFPNKDTDVLTAHLNECFETSQQPVLNVTRPLGARLDLRCFDHLLFVASEGYEECVLGLLRNACEFANDQSSRMGNVYFSTVASEMSKVYWLHNILEELTQRCEFFCPVVFVQTSQSQSRDSNVGLDFLVSFQAGRKVTRGQRLPTRTRHVPDVRAKPEFLSYFGGPRFRIQKSVKKNFARSSEFDDAFTIPVMAPDFHLLLTCIREDTTQLLEASMSLESARPSGKQGSSTIGTVFCGDDLYRLRVEKIANCFSDRHCLFEFYDLSP